MNKAGKQIITIQIYPKEGQDFIAENADVDVKLKFAKDKDDGVDTYINLANVELPEDIGSKKLPYFELKIPFEATVPFDFSKDLQEAQDISKISNFKEKIVIKYNQLRNLLVNGDWLNFMKEIEYSDLKSSSYLYATKQELIAEDKIENLDITRLKLNVKNRKVDTINEFEIILYSNNKLAILRNKKNKSEILNVEFETENGIDGATKPIILYMPSGSNELKVW